MLKTYVLILALALAACANATASPPTAAPTPAPTESSFPTLDPNLEIELALMQQAAQVLGCVRPGAAVAADTFGFLCEAGAGHSTAAQLTRYPDETLARAAFDSLRAETPLQCFHFFPAVLWEYSGDSEAGRHRQHTWLAGNWLIIVDAFDANEPPTAPTPRDVSEAIFAAADVNGFLPAVDPDAACS